MTGCCCEEKNVGWKNAAHHSLSSLLVPLRLSSLMILVGSLPMHKMILQFSCFHILVVPIDFIVFTAVNVDHIQTFLKQSCSKQQQCFCWCLPFWCSSIRCPHVVVILNCKEWLIHKKLMSISPVSCNKNNCWQWCRWGPQQKTLNKMLFSWIQLI